jgi:NADH-quinone oxidoreductase subunit C
MTLAAERPEVAKIKAKFGDGLLKTKVYRDELFLCVKREIIAEVLGFLKTDPELDYEYFSECLGVDYSKWLDERDLQERFEVVYNLMSITNRSRVFVKIGVNDGDKVPTCKNVFLGAEYPEREVNDLFGIVFEGNEQTMRFLLPDDWIGYPLRKEYPLGGEDVNFDQGTRGPAVEDQSKPHAGESFEGKTGSGDVSGR